MKEKSFTRLSKLDNLSKGITALIAAFFAVCLFPASSFSQPPGPITTLKNPHVKSVSCAVVGDPYFGDCFAGVDKFLARAIIMQGLTDQNIKHDGWGNSLLNDGNGNLVNACDNGFPSDPDYACKNFSQINCPGGAYCPTRYRNNIQMLVDLKVGLVNSAFGYWGSEIWLQEPQPGKYQGYQGGSFGAARQTVKDINAAYDCAGLRRPIIQASFCELITAGVNSVPLLFDPVKQEFQDDPEFDSWVAAHPFKKNFDVSEIAVANNGEEQFIRIDIRKLEARMWLYYVGRKYIDFGYKSIHLGAIEEMLVNDLDHYYMNDLLTRLRNYATSKGTWVAFSSNNNENRHPPGTDNFLFDFNFFPIRPIECDAAGNTVTSGVYSGDLYCKLINGPSGDCSTVVNNSSINGVIPITGCQTYPSPYLLQWDNYSGISGWKEHTDKNTNERIVDNPGEPGIAHSACWESWGYDEGRWWYEIESNDTREQLLEDFLCGIRTKEQSHRGYIELPGLKTANTPDQGIIDDNYTTFWSLLENESVYNIANTLWTPNENTEFNYSSSIGGIIGYCTAGCLRAQSYTFKIKNPDCSSVYTWHIQNPNGTWQPYTYGRERIFVPTTSGPYRVTLRQDNLGFSDNQITKSVTYTVNLSSGYCDKTMICGSPDGRQENEEVNNEDVKVINRETLKIYPNPSDGTFTIVIYNNENEIGTVTIYNMMGKKISEELVNLKEGENKINFQFPDNTPDGIYLVRFIAGKKQLSGSVIKSRF